MDKKPKQEKEKEYVKIPQKLGYECEEYVVHEIKKKNYNE